MTDYRAIVEELAADIASGVLPPGARLPPQRPFAYARGIAPATAARVYAELIKRGLVTGEVGRGTYVRALQTRNPTGFYETANSKADLQLAIADISDMAALLTPALARYADPRHLPAALSAFNPYGPPGAGALVAPLLAKAGWMPAAQNILFAGSGRQALAGALSSVARAGERIGVEPLTYPSILMLAQKLGIELVPLEVDEEGVVLEAVSAAHKARPLAGLCLQPSLHNPLGITMKRPRREALAGFLKASGMPCIEDGVFAYLSEEAPLAAYAPEQVIYVDSLSKRLAPGSGVGFLVAPPDRRDAIATGLRMGGWSASSLSLLIALAWIEDGSIAAIAENHRAEALRRQDLAKRILTNASFRAGPAAFHLWLDLPERWRADLFTAAAALQGVAITPASAFAVASGHAPAAVRVALSRAPLPELEWGLARLNAMLAADPSASQTE